MRKILLSIGIIASIFSVAFAQQKKYTSNDPLLDSYKEKGAPLPALRIVVDTLKHEFTEKDFESKHNFFLFMFNPTCSHCINTAKLVEDNFDIFKNNRILFMAGPAMLPYLGSFYQSTGIEKFPAITVGVDSAFAIEKIYEYQMLPQLNIYDKNHKLITIFHGDIPLDSLKKYAY